MSKSSDQQPTARLDKHLFESGQQCVKKLYLDRHEGEGGEASESRKAMAAVGAQLLAKAKGAFPRGVEIEGDDDAALARTAELIADPKTLVLFGATFLHDGVLVRTDILLRHAEKQFDLFEVKSGTKANSRYIADLAMQVLVLEGHGLGVRTAHVLHVNPRYVHAGGDEHPAQQILVSEEVTPRVRARLERVQSQLQAFAAQMDDASALELPMGTWCHDPFPCPHLARCRGEGPAHPLIDLPELSRELESELHQEGIEELSEVDAKRPGLSFRQRRTIMSVQQQTTIVEPFVREELQHVQWPLHCLSIAHVMEPLPRFAGQRPWRRLPFGYATHTLHRDGRITTQALVSVERDDPRAPLVQHLQKTVAEGGSLLCWGSEALAGLRPLLEELPGEKAAVRALLNRPNLDLRKLFEVGIFHPGLGADRELPQVAAVLLGDRRHAELPIADPDALRAAWTKATTPRTRSATKEKLAAEIQAWLDWQSSVIVELYRRHARLPEPAVVKPQAPPAPPPVKPPAPTTPRKRLPNPD